MKKRSIIILLSCLLLLACLILPGFYNALKVVTYRLPVEGAGGTVRIALVTDLHSCAYGAGMKTLLDALDAQTPDLVLLGGDIFDDVLPDDNTETFLRGIGEKYPCYYVTGNHEYRSGAEAFARKMAILESCGVSRLSGEAAEMTIHGLRLCVCGVDDPDAWRVGRTFDPHVENSFSAQLAGVSALADPDAYNILLTHRPEFFGDYCGLGFDLVLVGHAHGGQWRIPGILNGLLAPNQGLFPKLAGGQYERDGTVMIISRGLARESTRVPRWYNRPELVIIDLVTPS